MAALRTLPVVVEILGWDEAFLGARTDDPERLAADVQHTVEAATGLSCSVGIGDNKLRAKLATGFAKPAGIYRLTEENWAQLMAGRPTEALWGIGRRTSAKLAAEGITTVGQLALADPERLASHSDRPWGRGTECWPWASAAQSSTRHRTWPAREPARRPSRSTSTTAPRSSGRWACWRARVT